MARNGTVRAAESDAMRRQHSRVVVSRVSHQLHDHWPLSGYRAEWFNSDCQRYPKVDSIGAQLHRKLNLRRQFYCGLVGDVLLKEARSQSRACTGMER
jgi:hypothetical protein